MEFLGWGVLNLLTLDAKLLPMKVDYVLLDKGSWVRAELRVALDQERRR